MIVVDARAGFRVFKLTSIRSEINKSNYRPNI